MRRVVFALLCVAVVPSFADKPGRGHGRNNGHDDDRDGYTRTSRGGPAVVFRPQDRRVIHNYYYGGGSNLPPGLAKRGGNLPPGLQKQLSRRGRLPPGLDNRIDRFPAELDRQLPPLPEGYYRGMIGDQAVIYDPKTQLILDVVNVAASAMQGH
jgi:hypothetical protein